jgi:hypothetical protein
LLSATPGKCLEKAETETSPARKAELLKWRTGLSGYLKKLPAPLGGVSGAILYHVLMFISGVPAPRSAVSTNTPGPSLKRVEAEPSH